MSKELDELKEQLNILQQKVNELEAKDKENNEKEWWTPNIGENYYYIGSTGKIHKVTNYYYYDEEIIKNLNGYKAEELAERKAFEQLLHRKLEKFAYENNDKEIDWDNGNIKKYYIWFNNSNNNIEIFDNTTYKNFGQVYFSSEEIATEAIQQFYDDLIRYFKTDK